MRRLINALTRNHREIENKIAAELKRSLPDSLRLRLLKKLKLRTRDRIEWLERAGHAPVLVVRRRPVRLLPKQQVLQ